MMQNNTLVNKINPDEQQYLDLVERVIHTGEQREDRTGVGTKALFGTVMRFDLREGRWPLLTTKKIPWKLVVSELLWFLRGETNIKSLLVEHNSIWTDWPYQKYQEARKDQQARKILQAKRSCYGAGDELYEEEQAEAKLADLTPGEFEQQILRNQDFANRWGELGPVYGKQWRRWQGADGKEYDQIAKVMEMLEKDPSSRRILFQAWNVAEIEQMALPPCHVLYQFFVSNQGELSLTMYQRSADLGLGVPFNLASGALLTHMMAKQTGLRAKELVWMGGDTHVYLNHVQPLEIQIQRQVRACPQVVFKRHKDLFSYQTGDFQVIGYDPWEAIKMEVAV